MFGGIALTKSEELRVFIERADELINSKYILADIKIVNLLKAIASSDTLIALFKNCLDGFDYNVAKKKYLVKNPYLSDEKGQFVLPPNSRELLAFVFNVLMDIDAKRISLGDFIDKYFYEDGSSYAGYSAFVNAMIKPFKNSVALLMEKVIEGKLQDPVEAVNEAEENLAFPLIERRKGGSSHDGAILTEDAKKFIKLYWDFQSRAKERVSEEYEDFRKSYAALFKEDVNGSV